MFEYATSLIKERIQLMNDNDKTQTEIYLGVSNISDSIREFLSDLGWRALYVEQGIFQLSRL